MSEILDSFSALPRRNLLAWSIWGIVAVVLVGVGLMITPPSAVTFVDAFRALPRWHQIVDIIWGAMAIVLIIQNLIAHGRKSQQRFDRIEQKVDLLLVALGSMPVPLGELRLPAPAPQLKVGWTSAVTDTTKARSFAQVDAKRAEAIFELVTEPSAVVNAALDGRIAINRIVLDELPKTEAVAGARFIVRAEVSNNTSTPLSLAVPKGQVFENASRREKVQNLVVSNAMTIICPANASVSAQIPAYCLNKHLGPPKNHEGNITPLKVKFAFTSQQSVWDGVAEILS